MKKPMVWSIAGIDPAGLSGSLIDMETFKNFNVDSSAIVTAVTAQNVSAVTAIEFVSSEHVIEQCNALRAVFKPDVIKMGMLGTLSTIEKMASFLKDYSGLVVLDPIISASSEAALIFSSVKEYIEALVKLFPYVDVITPNLGEAEMLLNRSLTTHQEIEEGAHALLVLGAKSVLIKGGHTKDALFCQDYWTNGQEAFWLASPRLPNKNYRGTGCTLSSAIAACLGLGYGIKDAIVIAKMYINRAIRRASPIDCNTAKLFHANWPEDEIDVPYLSLQPLQQLPKAFERFQTGLYPVVDSSYWVEKLLAQGVKCIQLRIKNTAEKLLREEIQRCVFFASQYNASLFINDYWELAIEYGAQGVHLGQEDLLQADVDKIRQRGLYLGVSTHCYYEVARAHALNPSYIACGPIYLTTSKIMPFKPQGIEQLHRWRRTLNYPLVCIGGITLERLPQVLRTGIEGVSLISAITKATNPDVVTQQLLVCINEFQYD